MSEKRLFTEVEPGRKGEILDAALEVFGEKGYDGGSMREIASKVGVSEPALYRHFSGKEAIFLGLLRLGAGHLKSETLALLSGIKPETLRPQLLATLRDRRKAIRLYTPLIRTMLPAVARNERFLAEWRAEMIDPMRVALTAKAAEIDAALEVPGADASREARVRALMALFVGFIASSFVMGDEPEEAIVDAALRLMMWESPAS